MSDTTYHDASYTTNTHAHYRRHKYAPVACGFSGGVRGPATWTNERAETTCPGCLQALGPVQGMIRRKEQLAHQFTAPTPT